MSTDSKNVARGIAFSVLIVVAVCLLASTLGRALADDPCKAAQPHLAAIKKNQAVVEDTRTAYQSVVVSVGSGASIEAENVPDYNRFLLAKRWNKSEVEAIDKLGCSVDWSSLTVVPKSAPVVSSEGQGARSTKSESGDWQWNPELYGSEPYKNERLAYYQDRLRELGITDREWLKWLSAQLIQENGEFTETRITYIDGVPCVFGLMQYNACGRNHMTVQRFWELHPEWKDWRYQLDQMAKEVAYRKELFNGELSCVILAHFHPNGSRGAKGLYASKGTCKSHRYYHTEVAQRLSLLETL